MSFYFWVILTILICVHMNLTHEKINWDATKWIVKITFDLWQFELDLWQFELDLGHIELYLCQIDFAMWQIEINLG